MSLVYIYMYISEETIETHGKEKKNVNKRLLLLLHNTLKIPLANVVRLLTEQSVT